MKLTKKNQKNTFAEFKEKWDKGDIEKENEGRKHLIVNRPSYRSGLVQEVWDNAKNSRDKVFCPNTDKELIWIKSKSRFSQWYMGHRKGLEYRELVDQYIKGYKTYEEFISDYNKAANYYPEDPTANMSHKFEKQ